MTKPSYSYKHTPSAGGSMTLVYIPIYKLMFYDTIQIFVLYLQHTNPIVWNLQKYSTAI